MENQALQPSKPQQTAVRARLARALESLDLSPGAELSLRDLWFGSLSTVCGPEVCGGGELVAGVLAPFSGSVPSIGLYAMEAEDAFTALHAGLGEDEPLAAYVALAGKVLVAAACGLCDELGPVVQAGAATLEEDSVIATLLRTHAPSDTIVVGLGLDLRCSEAFVPAYVYLLVEQKLFAGVLASVDHS